MLGYVLLVFGELNLARIWLEKMVAIHEQHDGRSRGSLWDPSMQLIVSSSAQVDL